MGDALARIARKFDMTVWQLKQFYQLPDDRIRIGQVLRIPTPGDLLVIIPWPPPEPKKEPAGKEKPAKPPEPEPLVDPGGELQQELENVRLQVFLYREMISPGPIDGKAGATFLKSCEIYQRSAADAPDLAKLKAKAEAALPGLCGEPLHFLKFGVPNGRLARRSGFLDELCDPSGFHPYNRECGQTGPSNYQKKEESF